MYDYEFYDSEKLEKFRESRSKKYISLVRKWREAKEKNNEDAMKNAFQAMAKHKKADEVYKQKAGNAGQHWF